MCYNSKLAQKIIKIWFIISGIVNAILLIVFIWMLTTEGLHGATPMMIVAISLTFFNLFTFILWEACNPYKKIMGNIEYTPV